MKQAEPFNPTFTLGERVETVDKQEDGSFVVTTHLGTIVECKVVAIAGGLGCFEPRKPAIEGLENFENKGIDYMVLDPEKFRDKKVVISGGGDSALDWSMFLADVASELHLVHRGETFRGAPDSAEKVKKLDEEGKLKLHLKANVTGLSGENTLKSVIIETLDGERTPVEVDYFLPLFGLSPKLGPIANWGLNVDKIAIEVDTKDYSTNVPGIFAIGDINTYENKLKLILCGFHEAALMAHAAYKIIYPNKKYTMKYTTVNGIESF